MRSVIRGDISSKLVLVFFILTIITISGCEPSDRVIGGQGIGEQTTASQVFIFDQESDSEDITYPAYSNDPAVYANEPTNFYANFTDEDGGTLGKTLWQSSPLGGEIPSLLLYDRENDGIIDQVIVSRGEWSTHGGLISFSPSGSLLWSVNLVSASYDLASADFNGDGVNEIAIAERSYRVRIFSDSGAELWNSGSLSSESEGLVSMDLTDFTGDGIPEIFIGDRTGKIIVLRAFSGILWRFSLPRGANTVNEVVAADLDQDGIKSDVVGSFMDGYVIALNNLGAFRWSWPSLGAPSAGFSAVVTIDRDGDGVNDGIVASQKDGGLYLFSLTGSVIWSVNTPCTSCNNRELLIVDLDGDGIANDILVGSNSAVFAYSAEGGYLWRLSGVTANIYSLSYGDIDGNGVVDYLGGGDGKTLYVFDNSGSLLSKFNLAGRIGEVYGSHSGISAGDLNRDGIDDIMVGDAAGYVYAFQDSFCDIGFSDPVTGEMLWRSDIGLWQFNRSFYPGGLSYGWSVDCTRRGVGSAQGYSDVFIQLNAQPLIRNIAIQPEYPTELDSLTCEWVVDDADTGDTLTADVSWFDDNGLVTTEVGISCINGALCSSAPLSGLVGNANYTCQLSVSDGTTYSTASITTQVFFAGTNSLNFIVDESTLKSLGFRWIIDGDGNYNAKVAVSYRELGESEWKQGLDLMRIHGELVDTIQWKTGNLFAGSILNLEEGTSYEVRLELSDPDGVTGTSTQIITASTKNEPPYLDGTIVHNVYNENDLITKAQLAQPGDVILLHEGTYEFPNGVNLGSLLSGKLTSETLPIVIRGINRDKVILDGLVDPPNPNCGNDINIVNFLDLRGAADYIYVENLTIRNACIAIRADGVQGLVVRSNHIYDVRLGIRSAGTISYFDEKWFILDNIITGWDPQWYPWEDPSLSNSGIILYGKGHVIAYNTIGRFYDAVAIANAQATPDVDVNNPPCLSIDIHNNELFNNRDDGIETDYCYHNVRVFENRITNMHSGISAQPFYGGPAYIYRNVIYNGATDNPLKLHDYPSGFEIYHNTFLSNNKAWQIVSGWQNAKIYNNLFMGSETINDYSIETGTPPQPWTDIDYNGYTETTGPNLIRWNSAPFTGSSWINYPDLATFYLGTGYEDNGFIVDYSIFVDADHPGGEGFTYLPDEKNLMLVDGSVAVDAGVVIPVINEEYSGIAPDVGAYEIGQALPHYGIRVMGLPEEPPIPPNGDSSPLIMKNGDSSPLIMKNGDGGSPLIMKGDRVIIRDETQVEKEFRYNTEFEENVRRISITYFATQEQEVAINIEEIKDLSLPKPEGIPYIYFNLSIEDVKPTKIIIDFAVNKNWVEENNVDVSTIKLQTYNEITGQWIKLPTRQTDKDYMPITGATIFSGRCGFLGLKCLFGRDEKVVGMRPGDDPDNYYFFTANNNFFFTNFVITGVVSEIERPSEVQQPLNKGDLLRYIGVPLLVIILIFTVVAIIVLHYRNPDRKQEQFDEWFAKGLSLGYSKTYLKQRLIESGWKEKNVEEFAKSYSARHQEEANKFG